MPRLDGSDNIIEAAAGYRITAPGLTGTVSVSPGRTAGARGRGPEKATGALDMALEAAGVSNPVNFEVKEGQETALPVRARPVLTAGGDEAIRLDVPDPGPEKGQLVLAVDEDGTMSWNFPVNTRARAQTPASRGAGGQKTFLIRRHVPVSPEAASPGSRGLVQVIGRKILKVLVYNLTDPVLGKVGRYFAGKWEKKNRPYGVRPFSPDDYLKHDAPELSEGGWRELGAGKSLLFIHGTTSTASTGFANFPRPLLEELYRAYGGRVFAFNHFTLSEDPVKNVEWLVEHIPQDIRLDADVICHSRGGLVARTLAGAFNGSPFPNIKVSKLVFAAAPNEGTILADAKHMTDFIDRYTNILNLAPPGPAEVVASILEGIITVVKVIAHAALTGLPGLAVMDPKGEFIKEINSTEAETGASYFAITSDFEPKGGLKDMVKQWVHNQVVDRVFGKQPNDLLVTTDGVYHGFPAPGFPIPASRLLRFPPSRSIWHSTLFEQPETAESLRAWLL